MARADLLIKLVKSGLASDKVSFRKVIEAIIAEERSKQHNVLSEQLEELLNSSTLERTISNGFSLSDNKVSSLFHEIMPKKRFSDLVLADDILEACKNLIKEQHRTDLLRSYNLEPRNRILLTGSPGNGKTSLAEAIAEELMVPLLVVRYESVIGTYLGETANRLKKLFEFASTRKCVLFLDEFETLGKERGDLHETGEIKRVVSSLLMQIDDLPSHVVAIAATNHPELLDRAVWRRFQVKLNLPEPSKAGIVEWFEKFQKRINTSLEYAPSTLANHLIGYNYSEIEEFSLSAYRQYVLNSPDKKLKEIISKMLKELKSKVRKSKNNSEVK